MHISGRAGWVSDGVDAPLPTASRCARKQTHAVCVEGETRRTPVRRSSRLTRWIAAGLEAVNGVKQLA